MLVAELLLQIAMTAIIWRFFWPTAHWFTLLFWSQIYVLFMGWFGWL